MPLADISFECPHCDGPLIAEIAHAGLTTDCPHCYQALEVPHGEEIDKNVFLEPAGLRRVLQQVRDREWENLRRELKAVQTRNAELAQELEAFRAGTLQTGEREGLRAQLEIASQKLTDANTALAESRESHGVTLNALRSEREQAHAASETFRAEIHASEAAAEQLRRLVHNLEAKLEVEHAKVFLMEAAGGGDHVLTSPGEPASTDARDTVLIGELQLQIAELRKSNHMLQRSRDAAKEELTRIGQGQGNSSDERLNLPGATISSARQKTLQIFQEQPIAGAS